MLRMDPETKFVQICAVYYTTRTLLEVNMTTPDNRSIKTSENNQGNVAFDDDNPLSTVASSRLEDEPNIESSSDQDEIQDYHPPSIGQATRRSTRGGSISQLLRTVTQVTEAGVLTGEAAEGIEAEEAAKRQYTQESTESAPVQEEVPTQPQNPVRGRFFSLSNKGNRKSFYRQYVFVIALVCTFFLGAFSIFWGSLYGRIGRLHNLRVAIGVESDRTGVITECLLGALNTTELRSTLGWEVMDFSNEEYFIDAVHKQKYWAALWVKSNNISLEFTDALATGVTLPSNVVKGYYQTGRDPSGVSSYVKPVLIGAELAFVEYLNAAITAEILPQFTDTQVLKVIKSKLLETLPSIELTDGRPMTNPTVVAPLQVGLIYLIILSLFQVLWFLKVNSMAARYLKPLNYLVYRVVVSQVTYVFFSLVYTCLNRAFQINLNATWRHGFGVFWGITYLLMSAVGGTMENMVLFIVPIQSALLGFWTLFYVIVNISGVVSPIELCPKVYRYSYGMPIKNGYELTKIVFFNTYKGKMGRYIGILVGWIVLNSCLLPFSLMFFSNTMKKKYEKEAQKRYLAQQKQVSQHAAAVPAPKENITEP